MQVPPLARIPAVGTASCTASTLVLNTQPKRLSYARQSCKEIVLSLFHGHHSHPRGQIPIHHDPAHVPRLSLAFAPTLTTAHHHSDELQLSPCPLLLHRRPTVAATASIPYYINTTSIDPHCCKTISARIHSSERAFVHTFMRKHSHPLHVRTSLMYHAMSNTHAPSQPRHRTYTVPATVLTLSPPPYLLCHRPCCGRHYQHAQSGRGRARICP